MLSKEPIPDFTAEELNSAIKKIKRNKSTGPDNIPNEVFIESDMETREIYRENFNNINRKMEIPEQWQEGEIKRLYKGKGTKGKCSNERGISLSSNYGKVYERMVNERILQKINISEEQAGGRKGSSTVDHIVLNKELILSAKKQNSNVDEALLDVTKAYDKAWLTGIMHVLYKQGLTDNHWTIVKRLNENLTARIQTKYGLTRVIKIRDSIRQGGVLSTTMYGGTMDEINKDIKREELGIPINENGRKIGTLLWVDDVILIALEGKLQRSLEITDTTACTYHIEFGEPKSNTMPIQNRKTKKNEHKYKVGDMQLKETNKYKTLGYMQNTKNNNDDHLKAIRGKTEAAYQNMMALVGNENFSLIEMEAIWNVVQSCMQPIITYAGEAWEANEKNYKAINQVQDSIIKRILKTPDSTPREALYFETGLLDPETMIKRNRLNMEARIRLGNNQLMKEILKSNYEESWIKQNDKIKGELKITNEEMMSSKGIIKSIVRKKAREHMNQKLIKTSENKSKMMYYLEGKKEMKVGTRANYMNELTRNQASTIFRARTRMIKVRANYKNGNEGLDLTCRLCKKEEETQKHVLEECEVLSTKHSKATKTMIFSENTIELKETAKTIEKRLQELEESNLLCYRESKKKKNEVAKQNKAKTKNKSKKQIEREEKNPRLQSIIEKLRARLAPSSAPARCNSNSSTSAIGGECT